MTSVSAQSKKENIKGIFEKKFEIYDELILKMRNDMKNKQEKYIEKSESVKAKFQSQLDLHMSGVREVRTDHAEYIESVKSKMAARKVDYIQEREKHRINRYNKITDYQDQVKNARAVLMVRINNQKMLMKNNAETQHGPDVSTALRNMMDSITNHETEMKDESEFTDDNPDEDPDDNLYSPFLKKNPVNKPVQQVRVSPRKKYS